MTKRTTNGAAKRRRTKGQRIKHRRTKGSVGAQRKLSADDKKTLQAATVLIHEARQKLGEERARHIDAEAMLLIDLRAAEEQHRNVVLTLAKKHKIAPEGDEHWNLNEDTMIFTRQQ